MRLLVMANTVIYENYVSGGDILLPKILENDQSNLLSTFRIHVMTTELGFHIWQKFDLPVEFYLLPSVIETTKSEGRIPLIYLLRTLLAVFSLNRLATVPNVVYTSSDFLPDVMPAAFLRLIVRKRVIWISRIYHVIQPPGIREGNFITNFLSFVGQRISFEIIKRLSQMTITLAGTYDELLDLGFSEYKLRINNAGVDLETIRSVPNQQKVYDAVSVGRLHATKGSFDLLELWGIVVKKKKDAQLAIIGGGAPKLQASFRKEIVDRGLERNVHYLGFIPEKKEVYTLLKSSKIFVDAEHEDGWSLAIAEAMACGLPVVAYKLKLFEKGFKQGAVTVHKNNTLDFADAVLDLLTDEKKRQDLADQAYLESEKMGWDVVSNNFLRLLNESCILTRT